MNITEINKNEFETKISIYPNPFNNRITIEGEEAELNEIIVYNNLEQNVTALTTQIMKNENKVIIDLSKLNTGIYYVKTKTTTNKVYKQ